MTAFARQFEDGVVANKFSVQGEAQTRGSALGCDLGLHAISWRLPIQDDSLARHQHLHLIPEFVVPIIRLCHIQVHDFQQFFKQTHQFAGRGIVVELPEQVANTLIDFGLVCDILHQSGFDSCFVGRRSL